MDTDSPSPTGLNKAVWLMSLWRTSSIARFHLVDTRPLNAWRPSTGNATIRRHVGEVGCVAVAVALTVNMSLSEIETGVEGVYKYD